MAYTPYSNVYKKKMDSTFVKHQPVKENIQEPKKEQTRKIIYHETKQSKVHNNKTLDYILYIIGIIVLGILIWFVIKDRTKSLYIFISIIILFFILFYFLHRKYEKIIHIANLRLVLSIVYILIIINMILGARYYSVEWAFLGFLIVAVIIYDSKIDSRFLILPALFLLGYVPFLLISKYNALAETIAVYVYYFLVVGVVLQFIEYIAKKDILLEFDVVIKEQMTGLNWMIVAIIIGIIEVFIIIANRFYNLEIWKYTVLYFFIIAMIFYAIKAYYYEAK